MNILKAGNTDTEKATAAIPELVYATGPISYDYYFQRRALFHAVVRNSWKTPGTLFSAECTTLAMDADEVLGFLISFHAPEFRERIAALAPVWGRMVEEGETTDAEIAGVLERADYASWLNPATRPGIHYIHAIAVKPEHRGKQIGAKLFDHAMELGRQQGRSALELDVLSDNPAVDFYRSRGMELLVESRAPKPQEFGVPPEWRMGLAL